MPYYAVRQGYNPGVYEDLQDALNEIEGFSNNDWRRFEDYGEAQDYVDGHGSGYNNQGYSDSDDCPLDSDQQYLLVCPGTCNFGPLLPHWIHGLELAYGLPQEFDGACSNNGYAGQEAGAGAVLWTWEDDQWTKVSLHDTIRGISAAN